MSGGKSRVAGRAAGRESDRGSGRPTAHDADPMLEALHAQRRSLVAGDADAIRAASAELGQLLASLGDDHAAGTRNRARLQREIAINLDLLARAAGRTQQALCTLVPQRTPTYDRSGGAAISGPSNTHHLAA